jgi:hypothetical protein
VPEEVGLGDDAHGFSFVIDHGRAAISAFEQAAGQRRKAHVLGHTLHIEAHDA